jgi:PAS domain-containing protein
MLSVVLNLLLISCIAARRIANTRVDKSATDAASGTSELDRRTKELEATEPRQSELISQMAGANRTAGIVLWHCDFKTRMLNGLRGVTPIWGGQPFDVEEYESRCVHPDDLQDYRRAFYAVGVSVAAAGHRYRTVLPGGRVLHTHVQCCAVRDGNGRPVGMVGVQFDITSAIDAAKRSR